MARKKNRLVCRHCRGRALLFSLSSFFLFFVRLLCQRTATGPYAAPVLFPLPLSLLRVYSSIFFSLLVLGRCLLFPISKSSYCCFLALHLLSVACLRPCLCLSDLTDKNSRTAPPTGFVLQSHSERRIRHLAQLRPFQSWSRVRAFALQPFSTSHENLPV
jgi:hypothetical protein